MKRWVILGTCLVGAAIVAVVLVMLLSGNGTPPPENPPDDVSSTPTPLPTHTAPTPASTEPPAAAGGNGKDLVAPFLSAEAAARENVEVAIRFSDVATGDALKDIEANATALQESGLVQVGSPAIVSAEVIKSDPTATPPSTIVRVCLDYSKVDMRAPDGTTVKDEHAEQRVATTLTLIEQDGAWLVADRTFADNPSC